MSTSSGILDTLVGLRHGRPLILDSHVLARLAVTVTVVPIITLFLWFAISWATSPLRRYPGPFLAGYTNLWRLYQVRTGKYQLTIQKLHEKYGPVVRIGPNLLDLDFPELSRVLYGTDGKWRKTEFYHNNSALVNGKITYHMFSTTDQAEHAQMKRPIVKHYSLGGVLAIEPHMDNVLGELMQHFDNRFIKVPNQTCDLGEWIAFHAWDLLTSATFSKPFGYMSHGHDFDGSIAAADKSLDYFAAVGQIPWLDFLLDKNPVVRIGPPNLSNVSNIAMTSLIARMQGQDKNYNPEVPDYLQRFIDAKATHPDIVHDGMVFGYLLVNLIAGADTTAISIRAIFYYVLKNPAIYSRLVNEIRSAGVDKSCAFPYAQARPLAYLEAVVREALRYHPGVAMLLERYVPEEGFTLPNGDFVPGGAAVGINPYIGNRNKDVWGADAEDFKPERWLQDVSGGETDEEYKKRMQKWNACDLSFGAGSRICLGRNIALVETYKVVATILNRYEVELVDKNKEWETVNSWFWRQKGMEVRLSARE
ncbi:putative cytochrome P450 E-class, group I [Triangularia verruculosa]|uniref:Cytochrome P450 E-class, group I n=1 Tax=Triangularia verruculosa TaxID=2587418 RepID=A0AAN7AMN5_9PEZI|nr:putative cytochrome P450 E-class, group I [Triangularia verruculosa]